MTGDANPNSVSSQKGLVQLVCLPFAGGGSAPYYRWRPAIPAWIELKPFSLPGHDGRLRERPLTDLRALVVVLADELESALEVPFVLLGHSMGGWLAFELARELRRRGARSPEMLIIAAIRAPQVPLTVSPIHKLPDQEFLLALEQRYGGVAPEVSASPELLQLVLPALRADVQMVETYRYVEEAPLEIEILAMGGTEDAEVSSAQLNAWQRQTTQMCSVQLLPGGHFFLFSSGRQCAASGETVHSGAPSAALQMIIARIASRRRQQLVDRSVAE
jgi:surfactin synthase thioesterase subunit